jgi:hypothetical protein
MPLILGTNSIKDTGFDVANSLRFNEPDNPALTKTPSSAGNRRTFTLSAWVKRGNLATGDQQMIFESRVDSNDNCALNFTTSDTIQAKLKIGGSVSRLTTNRLFRDVASWFHLVWSVDTTQSTSSDRAKLYVNGVQETSFSESGYPSQNADTTFNNTVAHAIGKRTDDVVQEFDGYIAEAVMIDGQALTPTSFGEFDTDSPNIWKPIDVSGLTFGTNGFYLDFEDSSALGNDAAGSNNFTVNNLTATDQTLDTCTNNFCTVNPLDQAVGTFDISEGNLKYERTSDTTNWKSARGTIGIPNGGKWYWEMAKVGGSVDGGFGGIATDVADLTQEVNGFWGFHDGAGGGNYTIHNGSFTDVGSSYNISDDDIIQIAFDRDNNKLWVGFNNTWGVNGGTPVTPSDPASGFLNISTNVLPAFMIRGSFQCVVNFGQDSSFAGNLTGQNNSDGNGYGDFFYTPPSGYLALCTKNVGSDGG